MFQDSLERGSLHRGDDLHKTAIGRDGAFELFVLHPRQGVTHRLASYFAGPEVVWTLIEPDTSDLATQGAPDDRALADPTGGREASSPLLIARRRFQ